MTTLTMAFVAVVSIILGSSKGFHEKNSRTVPSSRHDTPLEQG